MLMVAVATARLNITGCSLCCEALEFPGFGPIPTMAAVSQTSGPRHTIMSVAF